MHSRCGGEASQPCYNGCLPSSLFPSEKSDNTRECSINVKGSSDDLAATTSSTLDPYTQFTNHEALPSLHESYINFIKAFPSFSGTCQVDRIRAQEYHHLNQSNICFDYNGYGLFSHAQQRSPDPATSIASSSSSPPSLPHSALEPQFFDISYRPVNLHSQILYGGQESELESRIRERIMAFMNFSESEYALIFIANEVSAFKLVADSFQFESNGGLLTVYDHKSEALDAMVEICKEQGAQIMSSQFYWPNLVIRWKKLKKMIVNNKRGKRKGSGLFVFPVYSRVTGAPYSYMWMSMAQENGWHVLLDASALRPKEMDTLALSIFKPDFLVCSFYKVFGDNPSGFGCLFVKKSSMSALKDSGNPTSIGIVSIAPAFPQSRLQEEFGIADEETEPNVDADGGLSSEIECRGLDQADSMGLILISCRSRYLINWLVNALMSLQHPHPETQGLSLIRIYGPKVNSHRGPAVAFNVFDWNGEKIDPALVQKLADRNNISLSRAILQNTQFSDKNDEGRQKALESRAPEVKGLGLSKKTDDQDCGIAVVTAALSFLTNFEDVYRLWAFLSRFLDADFLEKERWRYMALNQTTIDM